MGWVGVEGVCGCGSLTAESYKSRVKTVAGSEFQSLEVIGINEF